MSSPRADHTATLLQDGRVMVAGGVSGQDILSSSEIYDPNLGSWSATGAMATARGYHSAIRLPDGTVLVAGGATLIGGFAVTISSSEIYDPATGSWTSTASMNVARSSFALVLLNNGKVMAIGGFDAQGRFVVACELYDPTTSTWSYTGALNTGRASLTFRSQVVKLTDGRVLVEGGIDPSHLSSLLSSAEIYDPQTEVWSFTGFMNIRRADHTGTLLPSGKVIVGGGDSLQPSTSEIFDPSTGTWTMSSKMTEFRISDTASSLLDGRVLVVGPIGPSTEIYDETTGTWTDSGSRGTSAGEHTATVLLDGRVLVAGGGFNGAYYSQADLFTPKARTVIRVDIFFTDSTLSQLPSDSNDNPTVNVSIAQGKVVNTHPSKVLAWINMTNTSGSPLQSLRLNATLPMDWRINSPWMPGLGAIHVYFANTTMLDTNPEITQPSTITLSTGNPQTVQLAIPSFNTTAIGHPLMPGQSLLLSVKLTSSLTGTNQLAASYPRTYSDTAVASAWTQPSFTGTESVGTSSAFFVAYARVLGDVNGDFKVDILDAALLAYSYGSHPGDSNWNPNASFDSDGVVDIQDAAVLAYYYGTSS